MATSKKNTASKGNNSRWGAGAVKATPVKLSDVKLVNKPTKKK